ncbi:MAG TPA: hypothetical protein QF753_17005 [Victivallales bacterium]|nr:hypothetical protein [Victivallales bacterium]
MKNFQKVIYGTTAIAAVIIVAAGAIYTVTHATDNNPTAYHKSYHYMAS